MSDKDREDLLAVAKLGAPRGVSGFLKLHSYSGEYRHLADLEEALLGLPGSALRRSLRIRAFEEQGGGAQVAFQGYDSPEKARDLTGLEIYLPRSKASPLRKDEWYIADLVGLRVVADKVTLGSVQGVLEGGADPLLEVRVDPASGYPAHTALVPFRKEFVGDVRLDSGDLELLAPWLLE